MANDDQKVNEYPGGVEDPRIVIGPGGTYVMTYTQWARDRGQYTVGIATSKNLEDWTKWGPAFTNPANGGRFDKLNYKSAGILTELHNGRRASRQAAWQVLDVLGRDSHPSGHFDRLDSLDAGRGSEDGSSRKW